MAARNVQRGNRRRTRLKKEGHNEVGIGGQNGPGRKITGRRDRQEEVMQD